MCTIIFSWKNHKDYDLVLASNRDEFYNRPTAPAHFWDADKSIFAGRDLTARGTWIGINKNKRFAALTNYRDLDKINPKAPSRGQLASDFISGSISPEKYLTQLKNENKKYNPFNLLVGDQNELWYYNNINNTIQALKPGLYGLSNGLLDDPWPKVIDGKKSFKKILNDPILNSSEMLSVLENKQTASDDTLPATGVPYETEKALSALFITINDNYGTRSSTVILSKNDQTTYLEKTHSHTGQDEKIIRELF